MSQFTLGQLATALSALGITVPVTDTAHVLDVHANTSTQAATGPLQTTIHCTHCHHPNIVNISAVPTVIGIPLPRIRVGRQSSSPALVTSAAPRVPSTSVCPPAGPTPVTYQVPTPISYAQPAPVIQANLDTVPVAQTSPTTVPVVQANPAPVPVVQANPAPISIAQGNPAPAPVIADSSRVVPQSATASISSGPDGPWYVVSKGQDMGVYRSWQQVSNLVMGVGRACFFQCSMRVAAQAAFNEALAAGAVEIL